ncbi:RNA polymerase sigma-B factor [Paraconexibacter sp. AEG42_29]|uniref:RNA polymerase sigma-B factor n=1 Tax=Paraconexibacter sp. AEG42_29 TaxID=2997339 RepID=A0AAU7B121_9ACTN
MNTTTPATSETELLRRISSSGDAAARTEMIERAMDLVHSVARRYRDRGVSHEELVQVGSIGLINAVDRFDPDRGFAFSTFAVPHIAGEIRRHFRDRTWSIRVTRRIQENAATITAATERLTTTLQRHPSIREIATAVELEVYDVLEALEAGRHYTADSLDAPGPGGGDDADGSAWIERVGSADPGFARADARLTARAALRGLQPRSRQILALRFGEDLTQQEIGDRIGLSQMHVSRLLRQALDDLRAELDSPRTAAATG